MVQQTNLKSAIKNAVENLDLESENDVTNVKTLLLHQALNTDYFQGKNKFLHVVQNIDKNEIYLRHKKLDNFKNLQNEQIDECVGSHQLKSERNKMYSPLLGFQDIECLDDVTQMLENAQSVANVLEWFQNNLETYFWMSSLKNDNAIFSYSDIKNDNNKIPGEINFRLLIILEKNLANINSYDKQERKLIENFERDYKENLFCFGGKTQDLKLDSMAVRDLFSLSIMNVYNFECNEIDEKLKNKELVSAPAFTGIMFKEHEESKQSNKNDFSREKIMEKVQNNPYYYKNSWYFYLKEYSAENRCTKMFDEIYFNRLRDDMLSEISDIKEKNALTLEDYKDNYTKELEKAWSHLIQTFPSLNAPENSTIKFIEIDSVGQDKKEKQKNYKMLFDKESLNIWDGLDKNNIDVTMEMKSMSSPKDMFLLNENWDYKIIAGYDDFGCCGYNFLIEENCDKEKPIDTKKAECKWMITAYSKYITDKPYFDYVIQNLDERVFDWSKENEKILSIDYKDDESPKNYDIIERILYDNDLVAFFDLPLRKSMANEAKVQFMDAYGKAIKNKLGKPKDETVVNKEAYEAIKKTKPTVQQYYEQIMKEHGNNKLNFESEEKLQDTLIDILTQKEALKNDSLGERLTPSKKMGR